MLVSEKGPFNCTQPQRTGSKPASHTAERTPGLHERFSDLEYLNSSKVTAQMMDHS